MAEKVKPAAPIFEIYPNSAYLAWKLKRQQRYLQLLAQGKQPISEQFKDWATAVLPETREELFGAPEQEPSDADN